MAVTASTPFAAGPPSLRTAELWRPRPSPSSSDRIIPWSASIFEAVEQRTQEKEPSHSSSGSARRSSRAASTSIGLSSPDRSGELSEGSEVQFNGIKVGEITRIRLDPRNPNRVLTDVRVTEGTPVRADSTAATESQGITGVSYVQISAGTPSRPLLKGASSDPMPVIPAEDSSIQALIEGGGEPGGTRLRGTSEDQPHPFR